MDWSNFWSVIWTVIIVFAFVAYLIVLWQIVTDLFRDKGLSGWWKIVWIIALIIAPYLSAFIYIIARGRGMVARQEEAQAQWAVATQTNPADQIATAKGLLDSGAISAEEFDSLKAHALQGTAKAA